MVYPNPFSDFALLEFSNPSNEIFTLGIYDVNGKLINEISGITSGRVQINRKNLQAGMYFYMLRNTDGKRIARGKLLVVN